MPSKLMPLMSRHVHFMSRHVLWPAVLSGSFQVPAGAERHADDSEDLEACSHPVAVLGCFGAVLWGRGVRFSLQIPISYVAFWRP